MEEKEIRRVVNLEDGSFRVQLHDGSKIIINQDNTSMQPPKPGDRCKKQNEKYITIAQYPVKADA